MSLSQEFFSRKMLWRVVTAAVVLVSMAFVVQQLGQGWQAAQNYPWQWRPWYLAISLLLAQAAYLVLTRAWRSVLRAISIRVSLRMSYWIFILSNVGRYVPGRVWQFGAAALLARSVGLSALDIGASLVVYQLYLIPVGTALALIWGEFPGVLGEPWLQLLAWLGCVAMTCAAFWPHILLHWIRPLATRLGMAPERWRMAWSRKLAVIVQCAAGWLMLSAAFGFLVVSVTNMPLSYLPKLAGIFLGSYLIGYLSLVTPGGLGVREGIMTLLLSPLAGAGPAAALAILSRLWVTVTEVVALVPAWFWYVQHGRQSAAQGPESSQRRTEA